MPRCFRIALVLETSGGGSGRHVLDLARGLVRAGHGVTVIWAPDRAAADFRTALEAEAGLRAVPISMSRSPGPKDWKSLRKMVAYLRSQPPFDIVHGHSSKAGALIRLLPRAIPGARIYTPHAFRTMDPTLKHPMRAVYANIERALADRAARIIAVSQAEHDHARSIGISAERLCVVVNGVTLPADATRGQARAAMGLEAGALAVGFIGRLEPQKDPLRFVRAVKHAARSDPRIRGVVIGDGPLRAEVERAADSDIIKFLGWQDGPRLMPGLDLYCMTSVYEAMPYTLLEALHAKVPIVMTGVGGAAEAVIEDETGHVLPVDCTPERIGAALGALARDEARRRAFGEAAGRLAGKRTIETMVDQTIAIYEEALAGSPVGAHA